MSPKGLIVGLETVAPSGAAFLFDFQSHSRWECRWQEFFEQ